MLEVGKDPADRIFPSLGAIKQYEKNYQRLVSLFEGKIAFLDEGIKLESQEFEQFVETVKNKIGDFFVQANKEVEQQLAAERKSKKKVKKKGNAELRLEQCMDMEQGKQNWQKQPRRQRNRKKAVQSMEQKKGEFNCSSNILAQKYHYLEQIQNKSQYRPDQPIRFFNQAILSKRERQELTIQVKKYMNHIKTKDDQKYANQMTYNPLVCRAHIRMLNFYTNFISWFHWVIKQIKYHICQICQIPIKATRNNSQYKKHCAKYHNSATQSQDAMKLEKIGSEKAFDHLKQMIGNGSLVIYKCNCSTDIYPSQQKYIQHVYACHEGKTLPYSSHIFSQACSEKIRINSQYNQFCIAEDLLYDDFYYCSECNISFLCCQGLYYEHINKHHQGVSPKGSSHLLNKKKAQKRSNQYLKEQEKTVKKKDKEEKREIEVDEGEAKMISIVSLYKGPFSCKSCQIIFKSYCDMRRHFQQRIKKQNYNHFQAKQNFIMVTLHRCNKGGTIRYYIPVDPGNPIQEMQLNVPLRSSQDKKKTQHNKMSYKEFIKLAIQTKLRYHFSWYVAQ